MKRLLARMFGRKASIFLKDRYPQFDIGRYSYGHLKVRYANRNAALTIGAFCSFASGVQVFLGGDHHTEWVSTFPFPEIWKNTGSEIKDAGRTRGNVVIGNDVWIGTDALVMSGVRIGNGAVIGARSVVTKDVPPYAVVTGVPAKVVRMRFDDEAVRRLEALAWWNWDDEKIARHLPRLLSGDIAEFLSHAEREADTALRSEPQTQRLS